MAKKLKFKYLDRVKKTDENGVYIRGTIHATNERSATLYTVIWDNGTKEDCPQKELRPVDTRRKLIFTIETTNSKGTKSHRWKGTKNGRVVNHRYNTTGTTLKQLQQFISDIKSDNYIIEKTGKK